MLAERMWKAPLVLMSLAVPFAVLSPLLAAPQPTDILVTDVTTRSFSVVWVSDVPSVPTVRVFADQNGTEELTGQLEVEAHPLMCGDDAIRVAAEEAGVMKVRVLSGASKLEREHTYYIQTVTTDKYDAASVTESPPPGELVPVTLQSMTVRTKDVEGQILPMTNDLYKHRLQREDGVSPAPGALLIGHVAGSNYPITSFGGDCIHDPDEPAAVWAYLDLNNVFSSAELQNMEVNQNAFLALRTLRGMADKNTSGYAVAQNNGMAELREPGPLAQSISLKAGWNMVAFQVQPVNPGIEDVLASVMNDIKTVWAYNGATQTWKFFNPKVPPVVNTLKQIDANVGLWIDVAQGAGDNLTVEVDGVVPMDPIPLGDKWNLVGHYTYLASLPVPAVFQSIAGTLLTSWHFDADAMGNKWLFYNPKVPPVVNTLKSVHPAAGYWINIATDHPPEQWESDVLILEAHVSH